MELVRGGDAQAFELVYDRHSSAAFSLAYRMCGRRATAEDVLQEAFLALWRSGARYDRTRGSVRNWILRIVHNRAVDALRRGVVRERDLYHDEGILERQPGAERTDEQALQREQTREVQRCPARAAARAEPRHRTGLLRRFHAHRDSLDAADADRHRQGPHPPGARQAASRTRRRGGAEAMSGDEHEHLPTRPDGGCGDAAIYLLGLLDEEQTKRFREHAETCAICRDEVGALRPAVDVLPATVPAARRARARQAQRDGHRARRGRAARAHASRASDAARAEASWEGAVRSVGLWDRLLPRQGARRPALALASAALLAGGVAIGALASSGQRRRSPRRSSAPMSRSLAPAPRCTRTAATTCSPSPACPSRAPGTSMRSGSNATVRCRSRPAALFTPTDSGEATVAVPSDLGAATEVMVTQEPAGGSALPTSSPVIVARVS